MQEKSIFCGDAMLEKESKYVGGANKKILKTKMPAARKHLAQRVFQNTSKERIPADKNQNRFQNYRTGLKKLTLSVQLAPDKSEQSTYLDVETSTTSESNWILFQNTGLLD